LIKLLMFGVGGIYENRTKESGSYLGFKNKNSKKGLIGGVYPLSKTDNWSKLNFLPENKKVIGNIKYLYLKQFNRKPISFEIWLVNMKDLFFDEKRNSGFLQKFVEKLDETMAIGSKTEAIALNILKEKFPNYPIVQSEPGNYNDYHNGQDIKLVTDKKDFFFQVKPYNNLNIVNGKYQFKSTLKYTKDKIDYFFFVSPEGNCIVFKYNTEPTKKINNVFHLYEFTDVDIKFKI
jgi:hypothetical protein